MSDANKQLMRDMFAARERGTGYPQMARVHGYVDGYMRALLDCGLSTKEVARSFLVAEPTMARRLVRAKRKIKAARVPYRVPEDHELPGRLRPVLAVVYLVYNAGLTRPAEPGLCSEAIRLARILATLMPFPSPGS